MGGAFTGVADSVDAVYWNPAGLAQPEVSGFNSTFVTNWHDSNYDIYLAGGGPVKHGGFGFAYVYNKDYLARVISGSEQWAWIAQDTRYLQFSYGAYLAKDWNLAIGASVKCILSKFELDVIDELKYGKDVTLDSASAYDLDIGMLWSFGPDVGKYKMFSIGCLVQDVLKAELKFKDYGTWKYIMNVRPGLSFRPDEMSIISLEVYDATTEYFDEPQIRIGAERWFGFGQGRKVLALRAGGYHVNNEEYMKAYTGGLGWKLVKGIELAYTLIRWDKVKENTHFVAINLGGF